MYEAINWALCYQSSGLGPNSAALARSRQATSDAPPWPSPAQACLAGDSVIYLACRFIQIKFVWVNAGAVLYKATLSALPSEYYSLRTSRGARQSVVDVLVLLLAAWQAIFVAQGIRDRVKHSKMLLAKLVSPLAVTPIALLGTKYTDCNVNRCCASATLWRLQSWHHIPHGMLLLWPSKPGQTTVGANALTDALCIGALPLPRSWQHLPAARASPGSDFARPVVPRHLLDMPAQHLDWPS